MSKYRSANMLTSSSPAFASNVSKELLERIKTRYPSPEVDILKLSEEILAWLSSLAIPMPELLKRFENMTDYDHHMAQAQLTAKPVMIEKMPDILPASQ